MLIHPAHMIAQGMGSGLLHPGLGYLGYFGQLGVFCIFKSNVYPVVVDVVADFGSFIPDSAFGRAV